LRGATDWKIGGMKVLGILIVVSLGSSLSAALISTTTTISSSVNPSAYGQPVTFTAMVTSSAGAPPDGETVTFLQGTNVLGTGALKGGTATFTISTLATGTPDKITAQYPGDATLASSKSAILEQSVNNDATTTSLTSSQNPSNSGQSVTFTATVSVTPPGGGTPTGNVIFYNGSTRQGGVSVSGSGVASLTTANLAVGTDSITAKYNGNRSINGSTSNAVNQIVGNGQSGTATTTTISSSVNPSVYGQPVTFTAVVSSSAGAPPNGETVTFLQGTNVLGTGSLEKGTATFTISTLTTGGTDKITAKYPGDSTFAASTSAVLPQVVNDAATTTSLTSSQNPSNSGQSVTFTATVSVPPPGGGTPAGNVIFYNGSTRLGGVSLSASGVASLTTANLAVGTDSVTANYNGSSSFKSSTSSPVSQIVGGGEVIDTTMTWDGVTRYYEVFVPTVLPANPPLLLMLHGTQNQSTPDPQAITSLNWGWPSVANQYEFILVKPASTYNPNTGQWNWNAYFMDAAFAPGEAGTCAEPPQGKATGCPDDAGFLRALITNLKTQYNVNPNMVYVAGFSSGAQMAERVGVEISDLVAAIGPASGQMEGQQAAPPPVLAPGLAKAPISVQEWQGTLDTELPPCNYGTTGYSHVTYYLDTVDDTFNYWTGPNANACTVFQTTQPLCLDDAPNNANDAPTPGMTGLTGNVATGCSESNIEVQFIWEPGLRHVYVQQYNTARWLFFAAHPK
jgi:poly(3-hydroxybutyrate) depolymerase